MQIIALHHKPTGEIIFSRGQHDYVETSGGEAMIDGGQLGTYIRRGGNLAEQEIIRIELIGVTWPEVYQDYQIRGIRHGRLYMNDAGKKFNIIPVEKYQAADSFERRREFAVWGTNGPKGDLPTRYISLETAETDHLQAILTNVPHLSDEYRTIINSILKERIVTTQD